MRDQRLGIRGALCATLACALLLAPVGAAAPAPTDRIWFVPGPGTTDYLDLFENPGAWPHARQLFDVFEFYQQHTQLDAPAMVGPNTLTNFLRSGAFQTLTKWGKKISIEVGAVKPGYCTADASGTNLAVNNTLDSIRAVQSTGATVTYLSMDNPFAAGILETGCIADAGTTADRIAAYVRGVHDVFPNVKIGLSDAYPLSLEPSVENHLDEMSSRGFTPAFLHLDVDSRDLPRRARFGVDFNRDTRALRDACAARGIPFGIIIWGYNGDSDTQYVDDAEYVLGEITGAFTSWDDMPAHIIVQSWAQSSRTPDTFITPANLPEDRLYTHTNLLAEVYRRMHGQNGPATGVAVTRK